jgi:uncharacterized protein (DUF305 family)
MKMYIKFIVMILTSTAFMYAATYLNSYSLDHVFWSETRFYMSLVMGSIMAVVMLLFMRHMYQNKSLNLCVLAGSLLLFSASLYLVRSQVTVGDVSYMKAMIPHHSIAILTSERAKITDPRVRKLADEIIEAQKREISEMKNLIQDLESR